MVVPSTCLLHLKKEVGSFDASSAQVKKEPGVTPASFIRVKKEHGAAVPPSMKKARRLAEDAARQLEYQAPDGPEGFLGLRAVVSASFNEVRPETLEFVLAWSRQDARKSEAER
jgi:hypothetical protein